MPVPFHGAGFRGRTSSFLVDGQLVETDAATVVVACCKRRLGEITHRLGFEVTFAIVNAFIQKHLHDGCQVMGIGKQTCMTRHTAKHGSRLVVDIAPNQLTAKNRVVFRRCNLFASEMPQGFVANVIQAHRIVKILSQIILNILIGNLFHDFRDVVEAHVAVQILLLAQRGL